MATEPATEKYLFGELVGGSLDRLPAPARAGQVLADAMRAEEVIDTSLRKAADAARNGGDARTRRIAHRSIADLRLDREEAREKVASARRELATARKHEFAAVAPVLDAEHRRRAELLDQAIERCIELAEDVRECEAIARAFLLPSGSSIAPSISPVSAFVEGTLADLRRWRDVIARLLKKRAA
jgi:hypothetical protein